MKELLNGILKAPIYHLGLEGLLLLWVLWLIFHKSYKPKPPELSEEVIDVFIFISIFR